MSKNLIPQIAQMLGVELGEEFKVVHKVVYKTGFEIICNFTKEGVFVHEEGCSGKYDKELLADIICGKAEIVKLPWKPKKGETYYTFVLMVVLMGDKWVVRSSRWGGLPNEYALLDKGWAFRTEAEAQDALPKVAAEMRVDYEL